MYENSLLGLNRSFIYPMKMCKSLLVAAKVVGFDKAELGLDSTKQYPLLFFYSDNLLLSSTKLSDFAKGRFLPENKWKCVFEYIMSWLLNVDKDLIFKDWLAFVTPMYSKNETLPLSAKKDCIKKGINWFFNARFFLSEASLPIYNQYNTDWPYGPSLKDSIVIGDGSMGVLEGHASIINYDGEQDYRYWIRNDVQGEVALAMNLAGLYLKDSSYINISENCMSYAFEVFTQGVRRDKNSSNYGLMSWTTLYPDVYYGDDNARALLGYILVNNGLKSDFYTQKIVECILANYRTSSKQGYRGAPGLLAKDIENKGWQYYFNHDYINPHPHFESWIWACYLWLYDKTGYSPLLEKAKIGISTTMSAYPKKWHWTNGIQQERARMILPLAWLVRIEPTEQHKEWLRLIVDDLLINQVDCGAIIEQMGDLQLNYVGVQKSNDDYGKYEASLIYRNGDPVSDMLYTMNFAFFGLNEAVAVLKEDKYQIALEKMADFLIRIQVKSSKYNNLDGAWFRAFNFRNWDYWADNADNGWGAWCTLTGWIQSWILGTMMFQEMETTYWDFTRNYEVSNFKNIENEMLYER